ncbi:hypothetical protein BJX68DRAFT_270376 [Aspergillus pseudodeflectus]|uniref:Uncharacterized protein n=1 Tax=Aspergillus pseudodeflectus TaxID=176178 RepID=A0ABR4JSN7_9EURO
MNLIISVPAGSTSHGDPQLLCTPPRWYEYIFFFFTNYLAHATTVIAVPGQTTTETVFSAIGALLAPSSGIFRAVEIFIRRPAFRMRNPLNQAAAARALCMVVKTCLHEKGDDIIIDYTKYQWMKHISLVYQLANIHGQHDLPEGYAYAYVPASSELLFRGKMVEDVEVGGGVDPTDSTPDIARENQAENSLQNVTSHLSGNESEGTMASLPENMLQSAAENIPENMQENEPRNVLQNKAERDTGDLAASYNIPKAIISLAQAIWATITIYRARGNQIDQYGYAAFGLTVAPYAYMSIINLIATCITPEYPAIYMVRTSLMNQAEAHGALITGEVGCLDLDQVDLQKDQTNLDLLELGGFLLSLPPLAIVGALSHFSAGRSSMLERGFTMAWLAVGTVGGLWAWIGATGIFMAISTFDRAFSARELSMTAWLTYWLAVVIPLAAPAMGGFVVVAKMLGEYGVCIDLS